MTDPLAIWTRGLTKQYGDQVAVDSLDLAIERGEVFGFLGPNGAGKTTTVKLLLGLVRPTAGEIHILGKPLAGNQKELLQQIGAMVEAPAFYPYLSGRDNLIVLAKIARITDGDVDVTLERVGLSPAAKRKFSSYSMGMKQRLAIAAALLRKPSIVLLDEPTSGLDPAGQREVRSLIPELARGGCTVFLSSHMMHEVQEICDRVGILREGRLVRTAPVDQLIHPSAGHIFEIEVGDMRIGLETLSQLEWISEVTSEGDVLIVRTEDDRAADLNRALAEQGIFATEIHRRERTLEEVFFEDTEEHVA